MILNSIIKKNFVAFNPLISQVRNNLWPKSYIEPKVHRKELEDIQKEDPEEYHRRKYCPVKATPANKSESVFFDPVVTKMVNMMMIGGNKATSFQLMRDTLYELKKKQLEKYYAAKTDEERDAIELDPVKIFNQASQNVSPVMITRGIRRGGVTYNVPFPIQPSFGQFLGLKWLRGAARERPKPKKELLPPAFARELLNAYNKEGRVVKRKQDLHKLCEINRTYAHYRWG